jgi:HEAT repeat protein
MGVRQQALEELGAGGAAAVPVLREIIAVDLGVQELALRRLRAGEMAEIAMARIGRAAVPAILDALGDDNTWARIHAAGAAGRMHPAPVEAVGALTENLKHADDTVRTTSARALGEIGPQAASAAAALAIALGDEKAHVREAAATSLGGIGAAAAEASHDALVAALRDPEENVRAEAVMALEALGPRPHALPALIAVMQADDLASLYAPSAIGAMGSGAAPALPQLIAALGHATWDRRSSAAGTLGKIGAPAAAATDALLGLLKDPVMVVRESAAEALGLIGVSREDVREALAKLAAEDGEARVQTAAKDALELLAD